MVMRTSETGRFSSKARNSGTCHSPQMAPTRSAAQAAGIRFRTRGKAKPRQPGSSSSGLPKHCTKSWSGKVRTRPIQPMSASIAARSDPSGTAGSTPSIPRTPMPTTVRTGMTRHAAAYHHSPTRQRFRPPSSPRTPRFPRVRPVTTIAEISAPVTPRVCSTMTSGEPRSESRLEPPSYRMASGTQNNQAMANASSR